jgi:hypothetical protein
MTNQPLHRTTQHQMGNHKTGTRRSTAIRNRAGVARPGRLRATPATRQKRLTSFFPRTVSPPLNRHGAPAIKSCGVLSSAVRMLFLYANYFACVYVHIHTHVRQKDKEDSRCRPLQALQAAGLALVPAVYSMITLGRHEGSRIVAAGLWEPCNRCDVLRHIVRSWQTLPRPS